MWNKAVTLMIAMMLIAPWSTAQSTFGSIVGVVKDPSQSAVAGAQLTLTNLEEGSQRNATSDANGGFEFINLKAAHYELVVHADGFADYKVSSTQLDARQNLRFDVLLKVGSSTQMIEVSSDAGPVINTENIYVKTVSVDAANAMKALEMMCAITVQPGRLGSSRVM